MQPRLVAELIMGVYTPVIGLTLALLVLGVLADNHNAALALDDLALLAHGLNGRSDFHFISSITCFSTRCGRG